MVGDLRTTDSEGDGASDGKDRGCIGVQCTLGEPRLPRDKPLNLELQTAWTILWRSVLQLIDYTEPLVFPAKVSSL